MQNGNEPILVASGFVSYIDGVAVWVWKSTGFASSAPTLDANGVRLNLAPGNFLGGPVAQKGYEVDVQMVKGLGMLPATTPAVPYVAVAVDGAYIEVAIVDATAALIQTPFYVKCYRANAV